ncbi:MAG: polysaccharide lyase family 8 super-sandwich domain-containing protein, partial [Terrimicrobiaceae bacterium]
GEMPREWAEELQQFLRESQNKNLFMLNYPGGRYHGTRYFYNNDDAIKKTPAYYVLINMSSSRTDGLESAYPTAAGYNFYACDGSALLERKGGEHKLVLGAYNLSAWPGVTARQVPELKPVENWSGYSSSGKFAGGVADGSDNFVAGFLFDKENVSRRTPAKNGRPDENPGIYDLRANKSYFMLGDTLLALGAGIDNKDPKLEGNIWTTVEQTVKSQDYAVASAGGLDWIRNNNVFYAVIPGETSGTTGNLVEKRKTRWRQLGGNPPNTEETEVDVFQLWIDHGRDVSQGKYAYMAHFGDKVPERLPVILANSTKVQAASSPDGDVVGAVFYDAASKIDTPLGTLAVSAPCVVMLSKASGKVSVIAADAEMTEGLDRIGVTIEGRRIDVPLPQGLHKGKQGTGEFL